MDTSYAMAKFGLESKDSFKSKQKGCWHYMKYFFIFSSIIQFLIILGLVLFMLYGNAHGGTELRLQSVENRYKNLTVDHAWLKGNFSVLKGKLASAEKDMKNCSDIVAKMQLVIVGLNKTVPCPRPPMPNCNNLQAILDSLNMTCFTDKLKAENFRLFHEFQFRQYKENCTKTVTEYASKDRLISSENVQLQKDKKDLAAQIQLFQESCTTIDAAFRTEVDKLRNFIDSTLRPGDTLLDTTYTTVRCKLLSDQVNNRIDAILFKLRQDVNVIVLENSKLRVSKERINEDLGKCNQDKNIVTGERNNLAGDKTSLEKQLWETKDELTKSFSRYMKKEEELDACRRQPVIRPPMFPIRP